PSFPTRRSSDLAFKLQDLFCRNRYAETIAPLCNKCSLRIKDQVSYVAPVEAHEHILYGTEIHSFFIYSSFTFNLREKADEAILIGAVDVRKFVKFVLAQVHHQLVFIVNALD